MGAARKGTIDHIVNFLGADIMPEVVKLAKIQPTQRHRTLS